MKHHVYISIILCYLACIIVCAGCRSSYHRNNSSQSHHQLNFSGNTSHTSTASISSKTTTAQEEDSNWYRITYTFDTSQPTNPATGLSPISGYSIEGSQTKSKGMQEADHVTHAHDSVATTTDICISSDSTQESEINASGELLSGIDQGIKTGLSVGIPLLLIILSLFIYARIRKKDSSE